MSFDEILLPLRVGYGSSGGPAFSTEIIVIDSGYERRNQNWSQARRVYDARTGVRSASDAASLLSFFHARSGRARGFRLRDLADYSSAVDGVGNPAATDQVIGTGDGSTTQFRLVKNYTSGAVTHARAITKPVAGSVVIAINGVTQSTGWTVNTTNGVVSFAVAPTVGQTVTSGYLFDVPVRFDTDQLSLQMDNYAEQSAAIPIVEVRV